MTDEELKFLKVAKYRCDNWTLDFTRYFFKKKEGRKFIVGNHHEQICDLLDRIFKGEVTKAIINIAPRYGKTEIAVKMFIARGLALNPKARFIHLSYSDDLALDNSEAIKDIVKSEEYQQLYPKVQIKQGSDSKKKWYTTKNGGVYATSTKGQVTGFGAGQVEEESDIGDFLTDNEEDLFAGALVIDDPLKPEDADSEVIRERINERYDSTIKNRVNSRKTPIIIIMQRLHEKDLCGYLIEKDPTEWTVLNLPCIKSDGSALWEHKHTLEELEKMRKDNDTVFQRQYMQNPVPLKGLLFPKNDLQYFKPDKLLTDSFESSLSYADIADQGDDFLSAPIGRNIGSKIYITDVCFSKENTDFTIPLIADKLKKQACSYIRVESNAMGAMYGRNLRKELSVCQVLPAVSTANKHTRILMDADFIKQNCYFLAEEFQTEEYKGFMKQLCGYMKEVIVKHDDAADSMSGLAMFVRSMLPHLYS